MVLESCRHPLSLLYYDRVRLPVAIPLVLKLTTIQLPCLSLQLQAECLLTISSKTSTIIALILLALGYILSVATALLCKSWLFRLDILLIPCLTSCLLGFTNVTYSLCIHSRSPQWTSSAIAAITISVASSLAYAVAALWTFRKIYMVRTRDAMHRHHSTSSTDKMIPETEQQRQQLLRLLLQQEDARNSNPDTNSSTFKLEWEWPGNGDRRNSRSTLGTLKTIPRAARNVYESGTNSIYGRQDSANAPATAPMDSVAEEAPLNQGLLLYQLRFTRLQSIVITMMRTLPA